MPKKPSITSSTFKLLSSKEFTPKNRFCESGTRITTLINKETNKPIDAYVARVETEDPLSERRCIMVKDDNGDTNIGNETFSVV
ncbi:hypothetical protein J6T66_02910 [bacterium]|nr:hypothetical protein [bacterium]